MDKTRIGLIWINLINRKQYFKEDEMFLDFSSPDRTCGNRRQVELSRDSSCAQRCGKQAAKELRGKCDALGSACHTRLVMLCKAAFLHSLCKEAASHHRDHPQSFTNRTQRRLHGQTHKPLPSNASKTIMWQTLTSVSCCTNMLTWTCCCLNCD